MGAARAEAAARTALSAGADALVSWGSAGGLDPSLGSGTIVVPDRVVDASGNVRASDQEWSRRLRAAASEQLSVAAGAMLHSERPIEDPRHKQRMYADTGAAAVDMESGGIARIADEAGIPWIAVRVVVDPAAAVLPALARSAVRDDGRLDFAFIWRLATTPTQWAAFLALARANRLAGRAMTTIWATAGLTLAR